MQLFKPRGFLRHGYANWPIVFESNVFDRGVKACQVRHNVQVARSSQAAANLHLAACTPNFKIQEYFNDFADAAVRAAAPGLPDVVDGYFALPEAPGLGVTLDVDYIAEHPSTGAHFDLFADGWQYRGGAPTA